MPNWLRILLWSMGGVATLFALLWTFQRRLIYLPGDQVPPIERLLPQWNETTVMTSDGEALGVWYTRPSVEGLPVVIVFNGNAGTRAGRSPLGEALHGTGHGVVLFDYRGYGDSTGSPSERGLAMDARAIREFALGIAPDSPIVYFGESLGGAVAVALATVEPPDALILRSPFTSLADVAAVHFPLPTDRFLRDRYRSETAMRQIDVPTLVIAGSEDSIVPPEQSIRLHAAARGTKELLVVDGAGHNDLALLAGSEMIGTVTEFIRRHAG